MLRNITNAAKKEKPKWYVPKRYIFTLLAFFGIFNMYALRVNLSVAMVAMVNTTPLAKNHTIEYTECSELIKEDAIVTPNNKFKEVSYNWDSKTQGQILGSIYYGIVLTPIISGTLAQRYGAKLLFGISILFPSVLSLLTPLAASVGPTALIIVRILGGLGQGAASPASYFILGRWSNKFEISRIASIVFTGAQIGTTFAMTVSGWLCDSEFLGGWPSVFYVFGTMGIIWFILWCCFVYETPSVHPTISQEELLYIIENQEKLPEEIPSVPWIKILKSLPVWAVIMAQVGDDWGFYILLTELPSYFSTILHFDIKSNGLLSALPFILQAGSAWAASYMADFLVKSRVLQTTTIRKICNSIGFFGPAICFLGVTLSGCNSDLIVALFALSMAFNGFVFSGFYVSSIDMSPDFSGTLFGISMSISSACGFIGPAIVGYFTSKSVTMRSWNDVFYITIAIYITTAIFYNAFGTGELQPWGLASTSKNTKNNTLEETKP